MICYTFHTYFITLNLKSNKKTLNIYSYSTKTRKALIQVLSLFFSFGFCQLI